MPDLLYKRVCRLTIANKRYEDYSAIGFDVLEIEGLRTTFQIEKQNGKEPNTAEIKVYNLARSTRANLHSVKGNKFVIQAGYESTGYQNLFRGDIRFCEHVKNGPDWVTTIKSGDGERSLNFARISESFGPNTPIAVIVQSLHKSLKLKDGNVSKILPFITEKTENGFVAHGKSRDELSRLLVNLDYDFQVQDDALFIHKRKDPISSDIIVLDRTSGLIGSPEMITPAKPKDKPRIKIKCLLSPNTRPGIIVQLESDRYKGPVRVVKATYTGDTHGGDWYTTIEASIVK